MSVHKETRISWVTGPLELLLLRNVLSQTCVLPVAEFWYTDFCTSCLIQLEKMFYYFRLFISSWKEIVEQELVFVFFHFSLCFIKLLY